MSMSRESDNPPIHLKLPEFEPLPPDRWWNRMINNLLKPIFYLFFTMITAIVVVPIYTVIENLTGSSRKSRHAPPGGNNNTAYTVNGQPVERESGNLQSFLKGYGDSYGHESASHRRKA